MMAHHFAALCAIGLALSGPAVAADPVSDFALDPWVDAAVLGSTATYTLVTFFDHETPWVQQAVPEEPALGLDRPYAGLPMIDGEGPALMSDIVGLYPSFVAPVAMGVIGAVGAQESGFGPRAARAGTWFVVGAEAVTVNATLTHIVKHAVRRPRPYTYDSAWRDELQSSLDDGEFVECDGQLSFYSGHTSAAGAWSFAVAHSLSSTSDWSWQLRTVPYLTAAGLTAWTGILRVRAHKHFPTDVIVGGMAGAAVGILVPELHRKDRAARFTASAGIDGVPAVGISGRW